MGGFRKRPNNKAVPYLSHEFVIQNHGDIATCVCMLFVVGLMFQITTPIASTFIAPKHNVTELTTSPALYTYGYKDLCLLFFYTVVAVIFHAIIQEYILDKMMRKIRLSKTKANKFNESGQLIAFYLASIVCAALIFRDEGYFKTLDFFWTGYPHVGLTFITKLFFIFQMSYWLHMFPELYFQKVKSEDAPPKITFATVNFLFTAAIYVLNFSRIGLTLIFIDYIVNALFHFSRLFYFFGKYKISRISFTVYNVLFVLARLAESILSIFIFWFGLTNTSVDSINLADGNFNTPFVRIVCLVAILGVQIWMMWNFILFQFKKIRENTKPSKSSSALRSPVKKVTSREDSGESDAVDSANDESSPSNGDIKQKSN